MKPRRHGSVKESAGRPLADARGSVTCSNGTSYLQSRDRQGAAARFFHTFHRRGVTLIEMLIVMALVSLLAGISFPAVSAGLDSIRLRSAADSVAAFFAQALTRAERTQRTFVLGIDRAHSQISMRSALPGYTAAINLPDGVRILSVRPPLPADEQPEIRTITLYPGAGFPSMSVDLINARGGRRRVTLDPVTATPVVSVPGDAELKMEEEERP